MNQSYNNNQQNAITQILCAYVVERFHCTKLFYKEMSLKGKNYLNGFNVLFGCCIVNTNL